MRIAIIGYGFVGKHIERDVSDKGHDIFIYDPILTYVYGHSRETINSCDVAFVCVPTPSKEDGSCDTSIVEEVVSWLNCPVVIIRSTIPPGTLEKLYSTTRSHLVFIPEFIGEGVNAPYNQMRQPPFLIIGGKPESRTAAIECLAKIYSSECEMIQVDSRTAELCKYAENYFLALKVTWSNEMYNICKKLGVDYNQMMTALTHDYRIGRSHTHVYPDKRGWSGKCLPKDTLALLDMTRDTAPLLAAMILVNEVHKNAK